MKIEIKYITEEHIPGFREAVGSVARERKYLGWVDAPPLKMTQKFVRSNIKNNYPQFIAVDEAEKVLGWCDIFPSELEGLSHSGSLGIGLLPEIRGRGVGSRLLTISIDHAFANGMTRVELDVYSTNPRAIRLYEKFGFQHEGVRRNGRFIDGEWSDRIMMGLLKEEWHRV